MDSLSSTMEIIECKIVSITFDMTKYIEKQYKYDPYTVAFDFLLSQVRNLTTTKDKVCIILESRGKNEDHFLLQYIQKIFYKTGTKTTTKEELQKRVRGIFFNDKTPVESATNAYSGIEIVDLFSYPIYQFMAFNKKSRPFKIIEPKFVNYPNYLRNSIRLFADGQRQLGQKNKKGPKPLFTARDNPEPT